MPSTRTSPRPTNRKGHSSTSSARRFSTALETLAELGLGPVATFMPPTALALLRDRGVWYRGRSDPGLLLYGVVRGPQTRTPPLDLHCDR